MFDPEEQTRLDTERAKSRTFVRHRSMAPPRPRIEEEMDAEVPKHPGLAREHFIDTVHRDLGDQSEELPSGAAGDILYHDGSEWVVLAKPSSFTNDPVLRHDGTAPYWDEPSDVC